MASQDDCGGQGTLGKCITPTGSRKHPLVFKCFIKKKAKSACVSLLLFILGLFVFFLITKSVALLFEALSHVQLFATVTHRCNPLSMGLSRQEYWSGLPIPSPGDLPNPGIKPMSPTLTGGFFLPPAPREAPENQYLVIKEK